MVLFFLTRPHGPRQGDPRFDTLSQLISWSCFPKPSCAYTRRDRQHGISGASRASGCTVIPVPIISALYSATHAFSHTRHLSQPESVMTRAKQKKKIRQITSRHRFVLAMVAGRGRLSGRQFGAAINPASRHPERHEISGGGFAVQTDEHRICR